MFKQIITRFLFIALPFVLPACKKKKDEPPTEPDPTGATQNLVLNMNTLANNSTIHFTSSYTSNLGARFTLSSFRYYVSNIRLVRDNGSEYAVADKYLLVNSPRGDYDLGPVPVDSYIAIRFNVGVDSVTNHKDPTVYPASHPLAIQSPAIHWSWNSGYIFMMLEGSCDTTADNSDVINNLGQYNHPLFFHVGTDALYRSVEVRRHFHVTESGPAKVNITADLNKYLANIDLKKENKSHTMGSLPLATKLANNIPGMFTAVP